MKTVLFVFPTAKGQVIFRAGLENPRTGLSICRIEKGRSCSGTRGVGKADRGKRNEVVGPGMGVL
jgi:hypothetical protein